MRLSNGKTHLTCVAFMLKYFLIRSLSMFLSPPCFCFPSVPVRHKPFSDRIGWYQFQVLYSVLLILCESAKCVFWSHDLCKYSRPIYLLFFAELSGHLIPVSRFCVSCPPEVTSSRGCGLWRIFNLELSKMSFVRHTYWQKRKQKVPRQIN